MKKLIIFFLYLLILVQSQFNYPWYKNLICAGGWYNLDELIAYPDIISIVPDYSPIRFFIDYKNFETQCGEGKTYEDICTYKEMIKDQLEKAAKLMERIIKVRRFTQDLYFSDNLLKNQLEIFIYDSKLSNGISCDYIIILNLNQGTQIMNRVFGFAGNPRIFESSTLRPILGIIDIFNNDYRHMENKEYFLLHSFIHQIIHLLVFHPKLFFQFPTETPYIDAFDYTSYREFRYINTPNVVEYGKRHFNEDNFFGVPLDNRANKEIGMFHWHQRFMLGDLMIPELYQEQALSEITLALFEDSTWYRVNYYTGGLFRFGKGESFYFLSNFCINNKGPLYEFPTDFCTTEGQRRCTKGRMAKGYCKFYTDTVSHPFQYWSNNSTKGGRALNDYCPVTEKEDYNNPLYMYNFYPGNCKVGFIFREGLEEIMSDHSFCAVSNIYPSYTDLYIYGIDQRAVCYPMYCTDTKLTVQIGNFYVVCKKNGGIMNMPLISGYSGSFECPHYNTICTGTVLCNNIEDCIIKKSKARQSSYNYEGKSYEFQQLRLNEIYPEIINDGEGSENGKCGKNCIFCKDGNSCLQCREGDYSIGSKFNVRDDNNFLFCDLSSSFTSDLYEKYNEIYYPKNEVIPTLTYLKYYNLKFSEDNKWMFKIKLSLSNLNNDDEILVDIELNNIKTKAICIMTILNGDNILNCEINYNYQKITDEVKLIKDDNNRIIWTNLPDVVNMYIDYEINYINAYGGYYIDKWMFNIYFDIDEQTQTQIYRKKVLLDILVNDEEETALCEIISNSFLKCISNHENQNKNDDIKIEGNILPNLGSIFFKENLSEEQKIIKPISLCVNYENLEFSINAENILNLKIKGKLTDEIVYPIEEGTITEIEILVIENETEEKMGVACLTNFIRKEKDSIVKIDCSFNVFGDEKFEINIDNNGASKFVHFNLIHNININNEDNEEKEGDKK